MSLTAEDAARTSAEMAHSRAASMANTTSRVELKKRLDAVIERWVDEFGSGHTAADFQRSVGEWAVSCFGAEVARDPGERNQRFLEESLELVQSLGMPEEHAHALVRYVYGRPAGDGPQEVGGVMTTLAALCEAQGFSMQKAGQTELARCFTRMNEIREKNRSKPRGSPLPGQAGEATRSLEAAMIDRETG